MYDLKLLQRLRVTKPSRAVSRFSLSKIITHVSGAISVSTIRVVMCLFCPDRLLAGVNVKRTEHELEIATNSLNKAVSYVFR
jgi:hypothetical protein